MKNQIIDEKIIYDTYDGGGMLLRAADGVIKLLPGVAAFAAIR